MEISENSVKVDDPNSGFLSAAELVQIRKSNEEPARSNKGDKFYVRQNNWMESNAVECALENYADTLKQNRAARKCDLIQAEWNEELNVSITSKLKGKFLQHMGSAYQGKVALSPEESIFLLENGCIEIMNGKMPMSTEEAYKIMLKGDMSAEKYQVYSQLSQLGFIVVAHRKGPRVQTVDTSKHPSKRKRKSSAEAHTEPLEKKRTSFLGAFSNLPDLARSPKEGGLVPASEIIDVPDSASRDSITVTMSPSPSTDNEVPKASTAHPDETLEKCSDSNVVTPHNSNFSSLEVNDAEKQVPESVNSLDEHKALPSDANERDGLLESGLNVRTALSCKSVSEKEISVLSELSNSNTDSNNAAVGLAEEGSEQISSTEDFPSKNVPEDTECAISSNTSPSNLEAVVNGFEEGDKEINGAEVKQPSSKEVSVLKDYSKFNRAVSAETAINALEKKEYFPSKKISVQIEDSESCDDSNQANSKADVNETVSVSKNNGLECSAGFSSEETPVQIEDSNSCKEAKSNYEAAVRVSNNAIDIMNLDSDGTEVSCSSDAFGNKVSDANTSIELRMDACSRNEMSNSDVMSCSSSDEEEDVLTVDVGDDKLEDDDVELVAVTKKEKKPLAVIDLLSESGSSSEDESEDDDIQVVKVCESAKDRPRSSVIHSSMKCKKEERPSSSCSRLQLKFPHCARKEIVVVTRPPSKYLPPNVAPAKESYALSFPPCAVQSRRVWNSYRELQSLRNSQRDERFPPVNSGLFFHQSRFGPTEGFNSNSWNQNSAPHQDRRPFANPFSSPVRNSDQRNSLQGFQPEYRNSFGLIDRQSPDPSSSRVPELPSPNPFHALPSFANQFGYPPPPTAINSVVSVSNQDLNVSMVGNHVLQRPSAMQGSLDHMDFMTAVQRTAYSVASDVLSSMFGSTNRFMPPNPIFGELPPPLLGRDPSHPYFPPLGIHRRRREQIRRNQATNPFPCQYRHVGARRSWNEVREAVGEQDMELDVCSDVEEVPLNADNVLWDPAGICPLVMPRARHPPAEVLKKLQVTKMADYRSYIPNNLYVLTSALEISFDVYLPGTNYRKTSPGIPKHRIIVVRSTDPLPKYDDLKILQKKWNDGATLQIAVVDHGDISFQSFNSICLTTLEL